MATLFSHIIFSLKKILSTILIIQLAFPPSLLMAMEREDGNLPHSSGLRSRKEIPGTTPLATKLKTLYRAQNKLPKLIEDASVPEQSMDDYYVKLQIVLNSTAAAEEKYPIHLVQMFEKVEDEEAAGKVLVVGVAGIGKTTFLNHITHEWSQGKVFSGTFDTIFKIRLRSLLDEGLVQEISTEYTPEDRLAALIQRSIEQQQQKLKPRGDSGSFNTAAAADSEESIGSDVGAFSAVSLEEIKTVDRARTVLLLDGYDEIEHLNRGGHIVSDLMRRIFEYPYVVLTSRPNAVTSVLENRFERKIEAVGLGNEGIPQYMDRYFYKQREILIKAVEQGLQMMPSSRTGNIKFPLFQHYERQEDIYSKELLAILEAIDRYAEEKGDYGLGETPQEMKQTIENYYKGVQHSLSFLYKDNPILRETLTTPINLAMICLLATDPTILRRFAGEFNIGQLYEGVVVWLGKRYLTKFKEKEAKDTLDAIDIVDERILHLEELSVLEQAAYQEFKVNKTNIPGRKIDALARTTNPRLGIRQVNKYGLIKPDVSKPLYDFGVYLYGIPEDQEIKISKLCLYLDPDKKSLVYAVRKRRGIERVDLTAAEGLRDDFKESIVASLSKRERELKARDKNALFSFLSSNGYEISEGASSTKEVSREILEAQDLIHHDHRFIHLSFQEYLTAHSLKELLQQENPQVVKEAAQFIGEHRNEPRYLMTLKFLAGIVSKEQDDIEASERDTTSLLPSKATTLVKRFWDAVTCNVDGVLELGLENKITLLMHLLVQSKNNGQFDPRNPHLLTIIKLIDEVVLRDIMAWREPIVQSSYLSPAISDQLQTILTNYREAHLQTLETAIEIISSFVNREEFGGREAVFNHLVDLVKHTEEWRVKKLGLNKLRQIVDQSIPESSLKDALTSMLPLLKDGNIQKESSNLLAILIKTAPNLSNEMFSLLEPLLEESHYWDDSDEEDSDGEDPDWRNKLVVAESLKEVVKESPVLAPHIFSFLNPLLNNTERHVRLVTAESLGEAIKGSPLETFPLLDPLLKDSLWRVRDTAAHSLGEAVKVSPILASQILPLLKPLLKDPNEYVRDSAVESLGKMVKANPEMAQQVFSLLSPLLKDSKWRSRSALAYSLKEVMKVAPAMLSQDIITHLNSSTRDFASSAYFVNSLCKDFPLTRIVHSLSEKWLNAPPGSSIISDFAEETFLVKMKSLGAEESLNYEDVIPLFTIIHLTRHLENSKELNSTAQKGLKYIADTLDNTGLSWINAHFGQLPNLPETRSFLKNVYHTLLKKGHIDAAGRDFIVHCIQSGLTTTITRSGKIMLEGMTYETSPESQEYLGTIIQSSLSQQSDKNAQQYREHSPLFSNSKVGLRIAASDIEQVLSLVGTNSLMEEYWYLTILTPEAVSQAASLSPFILMEKRNGFGDRIVHKLNTQGQAIEKRYILHPDDTTRTFLERLFGPLSLSSYWAQSILLNEDQERELFSGILSSTALVTPLESSQTWNDFRTRLFAQSTRRSFTQSDLLGIDPTSTESLLVRHEKALQDGGVYDLATIRRGFNEIEHLLPQLKNYSKTFYWTMANYFEAYRSISTGLFQSNAGAEITTKEQIGVQVAKKGAQYVTTALQSIPIVGSAVGLLDMLIDDVTTMVADNRFERKVNAISIIIREKFQMVQDISSIIAKVALTVTHEREHAIFHPEPEKTDNSVMGVVTRLGNAFEEKLAALKEAVLPTIELNDPTDPGVQLALKDVTLTLAYLFKNHEEIIRNKEPLNIQMIEIIRNGSLEKLLSPLPSLASMSNSSQQTTTVIPPAANNNSQKGNTPTSQSGKKATCVVS